MHHSKSEPPLKPKIRPNSHPITTCAASPERVPVDESRFVLDEERRFVLQNLVQIVHDSVHDALGVQEAVDVREDLGSVRNSTRVKPVAAAKNLDLNQQLVLCLGLHAGRLLHVLSTNKSVFIAVSPGSRASHTWVRPQPGDKGCCPFALFTRFVPDIVSYTYGTT